MGVLIALVYILHVPSNGVAQGGIPPNSTCIVHETGLRTDFSFHAECWNHITGEHIGEFFLKERPEGEFT